MAIQIQKISNLGASHPFVARLGLQTKELLEISSLDKKPKEELLRLYIITLTQRLARCEAARNSIETALREDVERVKANMERDPRSAEIPFVVGLEGHVETFLYGAKNYLRDLLNVFRIVHGCKLGDASAFGDLKEKGSIEVVVWGEEVFGSDDPLVLMLRTEQAWTTELMRKRNALEHPGGWSGTLSLTNVRLHHSNEGIVPPTWQRQDGPDVDILTDMDAYLNNLLTLAEDILADTALRTSPARHAIGIGEIPEAQRDPKCPVRLRLVFKKPPPK